MRAEEHLRLDRNPEYVVDLSNVVREKTLCSTRVADLRRLLELLRALARYTRDETVAIYGVADASLLRDKDLSAGERSLLESWRRRAMIEVYDGADQRILEVADTTGARVICLDIYRQAHRTYPWIPGSEDRFLRPEPMPEDAGAIVLKPTYVKRRPEYELSAAEETERLHEIGVHREEVRQLLDRRWRCPDSDCPLFFDGAADGDDADQPVPTFVSGQARCPSHRRPLLDIGPTIQRRQLKVVVNGVVRRRFMVRAGLQTVVGRGPVVAAGQAAVAISVPGNAEDQELKRVSRSHVVLSLDGDSLSATDVSSNGIYLRHNGLRPGRPRPIESGGTTKVKPHDAIGLADGVVELTVSGRHFLFDGDDPSGADAPNPAALWSTTIEEPKA